MGRRRGERRERLHTWSQQRRGLVCGGTSAKGLCPRVARDSSARELCCAAHAPARGRPCLVGRFRTALCYAGSSFLCQARAYELAG